MGKRDYTVAEWKRIASALHYGAISATVSFENTQSALDHLYQHGKSNAASSSASSRVDRTRYHDYCYTHRNAPCPPTSECQLRLGMFFGVETSNCCVLCSGLTIQQTGNDFTYGVTTGQVFLEEPCEGAGLSLTHMKHLAVYHTPFFVMLILGCVTNKRYTLHTDPSCRRELATTVFNHYKVGQEPLHTGQDHDVAFLKIWWRYMNRQSSRTINAKIPYYLELPNNAVSQYSAWNPAYDRFAARKPEPIYTFIASHCVCRDVWDESEAYNPGAYRPTLWSSRHGAGFTVHSLQTPVSKLHIEPILDSIATAHGTGGTVWGLSAHRARKLRLDSVIVEESGDPTQVLLYLVVSLQNTWVPLESWLSQTAADHASPESAEGRTRVATGVLGYLTTMFARYEMPPRKMYSSHLDLMKTFFVNAETREVVSLLPYVCMRKMYRAVNRVTDDIEIKKACCGMLAEVLRPPGDRQDTKELVEAWWREDALCVLPPELERCLVLCKQGPSDNVFTWNEQASGSYHARSSAVNYGPAWSCEGLDTGEVKQKLEELGFLTPIRITIVELPRTEPIQRAEQQPRTGQLQHAEQQTQAGLLQLVEQQLSFRTKVPECFRGLAIALTANTMTVSVVDDILYQEESTAYQGSGCFKRPMSIDYNGSQSQYEAGPVQPKMSYSGPVVNNPQPNDCDNVSFRDAETDVTFFTHAIFEEDDTMWPSLHSASITYDSTSFDTGMFETAGLSEHEPITSPPTVAEAPPDPNEAPLLIVSERDLQNINYTVIDTDIDAGKVPWVELPPVSPSDQNVPNTETLSSAADMFDVSESLLGFFPHINQAYETDTRRNAIDIMHDRETESDAVETQDELDPELATTEPYEPDVTPDEPTPDEPTPDEQDDIPDEQDAIPRPPFRENGVPNNRAQPAGTRRRRRAKKQQHAATPDSIESHSSAYTSDQPQLPRVATERDLALLARCSKWRSNGVQHEDLNSIYGDAYTPYHTMAFVTPLLWERRDPTVALKPISDAPQTDPSAGLESNCCHGGCSEAELVEGVWRTATNDSEMNYMMGVEGSAKFCRRFHLPNNFNYTSTDIPSVTLDAKKGNRTYYAVDLSKPPQQGFRHVHLVVNEFPLPNRPHGILEIVTSQALCLGHVVTASNVDGLLLHRVFTEDMGVLNTVLNMHTRLQIHPFVPRTFAMELMMMPFARTNVTANFVGEHAGDWNLGSPDGLANMNSGQKCKLAYHVALCLVKAQILTMSILGFPLLRLHPARIWRHGTGFRLDFLACLLDHITAKLNATYTVANTARSVIRKEKLDSPISPVAGGARAIATALRELDLEEFTPIRFDGDDERENINVFYDMYLQLTQQEGRSLDLLSLLGRDHVYESFTVPTSDCLAEPFAPFYIQIHNQYVKWNKVVIVEPVQNEDILPTPQLYPHVGPPKIKKMRQPVYRDQRPQNDAPVPSTSADTLAGEANAVQSQLMPPPARARPGRPRKDNSARPCPDARPRAQTARAPRGRGARSSTTSWATASRATTSQATQPRAPVLVPETIDYNCILSDDYDMNTCGSTYYDG